MTGFEPEKHLGPIIPYTRKFAALIEAGVSLMRCLDLLRATTEDSDLAEASAELMAKVEGGATLSAAMAEIPELFSPIYVAFVRSGEIGGVLDETLADLADWQEREEAALARFRTNTLLLRLAAKVLGPIPRIRGRRVLNVFEESKRLYRLASFCRLSERCLTAGAPLLLSMSTAAGVLEEPAASKVRQAAEAASAEEKLAPILKEIEELGPFLSEMVAIGEETGLLELMLRKAAEFIEADAAHVLEIASRLPG